MDRKMQQRFFIPYHIIAFVHPSSHPVILSEAKDLNFITAVWYLLPQHFLALEILRSAQNDKHR